MINYMSRRHFLLRHRSHFEHFLSKVETRKKLNKQILSTHLSPKLQPLHQSSRDAICQKFEEDTRDHWLPKMRRTGNATMNHVARNIHRHETSSFSTCATSRGGGLASLSLSLSPPSPLSSLPFSSSLSVRTTHVQAIRYDWPDPRFRTNHFIKAVLNKPAFDYTPHHLVVIVSYTFLLSFFALCSIRSFRSSGKEFFSLIFSTDFPQNSLALPALHAEFLVIFSICENKLKVHWFIADNHSSHCCAFIH